jgi:hypothetical protein
VYYVKAQTRSSGGSAKGTPEQAFDYITDAHDAQRDPSYSDAELAYICRLDPGWKTDLEGGRVPAVGVGALADVTDQDDLRRGLGDACQPWHDKRGTTGYKSFTFTLPKEVSLFCEGHREEAKQALYAAILATLEQAFPGVDYSGVAAVHTRNEAGEIHYHLHVLVGKFARDRATGRLCSLNSKKGGNHPGRVQALKRGWKDNVDREFRERLGLTIEQSRAYARPALVLEDRTRVPPLHRESRRLLDKQLSPLYTVPAPGGALKQSRFRWIAPDERIFEIAAAPKESGRWSAQAFCELFPDLAHRVGSYQKRAETLKRIGYLTPEGAITPAFHLHYAARHGIDTPELQRLRADVSKRERRQAAKENRPPALDDLWLKLHQHYQLRQRAERLGYGKEDLARIQREADRRKPTRENLRALRAQLERKALANPPRHLPETKGVVRAYWAVQGSKVRAFFVVTKGLLTLRYREHKELAGKIKRAARIDLFYAKEKRLAQLGRFFQPIFWASRLVLPKETRRLEQAISRCAQLAGRQELETLYRRQVRLAYQRWRAEYVDHPRDQLRAQAQRLELPAQAPLRDKIASVKATIPLVAPSESVGQIKRGIEILTQLRPAEAAPLRDWSGHEDDLVASVVVMAKGTATSLSRAEYQAAVRAGRIGYLLAREADSPRPAIPPPHGSRADEIARAAARLRAFKLANPFTQDVLAAVPAPKLERALAAVRRAGILDEGSEWTLRAAAAFEVAKQLRVDLTPPKPRDEGVSR